MQFSRTLVAIAGGLLMAGVTLAAPTAKQTASAASSSGSSVTKTKVHHAFGVVDSITDADLTVIHTYKGKKQDLAFKLDSSTKKVGTIDKGSHVEVYYKLENGDNVATEIKAAKSKTKTKM